MAVVLHLVCHRTRQSQALIAERTIYCAAWRSWMCPNNHRFADEQEVAVASKPPDREQQDVALRYAVREQVRFRWSVAVVWRNCSQARWYVAFISRILESRSRWREEFDWKR